MIRRPTKITYHLFLFEKMRLFFKIKAYSNNILHILFYHEIRGIMLILYN